MPSAADRKRTGLPQRGHPLGERWFLPVLDRSRIDQVCDLSVLNHRAKGGYQMRLSNIRTELMDDLSMARPHQQSATTFVDTFDRKSCHYRSDRILAGLYS